jgi:hypothetical protein
MENVSSIFLELREQIQSLPLSKSGKRMGISLELRKLIVSTCSSSGLSSEKFCTEVGISYSCFAKWKRELNSKRHGPIEKTGFKKIKIDLPSTPDVGEKNGLVIEGPQGLRISGLSMSEVCLLWRSLC